MALEIIGVRHHSPACARLVDSTIARMKPRFVLIEGPSDMNDRLDEFLLGHELPIALFSYRKEDSGPSWGIWAPFCEYSPEWVALQAARRVGAQALFIDLPAWDRAFDGEENRYSDRHVRQGARLAELCSRLGFENTDTLWDNLFEQPLEERALAARLSAYFAELRADAPADPKDAAREASMNHFVAWAMANSPDRDVVVVCGGYHKPAIERDWRAAPTHEPELEPVADGVRVGSYLVPFSFERLDSFSGYASGMPSPGFHQLVWEHGLGNASEEMLFRTIQHLRSKRQRVSPADAIAASTLAQGLRRLRGHTELDRSDVLDGLASALVKDALEAPLPWTRRGTLSRRTEPLLVEMVRAFTGKQLGKLARSTPQPPLVGHVFAELERVGIDVDAHEQSLRVPLTTANGLERSAVLHRLRVLGIPKFECKRAPSFSRTGVDLSEGWTVRRSVETEPALIEAALYGATLDGAASAALEARCRDTREVAVLAETLVQAAQCGLGSLSDRTLGDIASAVGEEASLAAIGAALARLLALHRGDLILSAGSQARLGGVLAACFDRGLWLYEGVLGSTAPLDSSQLAAVVQLREAVRCDQGKLGLDVARATAVCRRRAADPEAPPALRGAGLGFVWSMSDDSEHDAAEQSSAVALLRSVARPETVGDLLSGIFALAREKVLASRELVHAIDALVQSFDQRQFLIGLPALRQAFAFFPPRERLTIAGSVLELYDAGLADPRQLIDTRVDDSVVARALSLESAAAALARRFGLSDVHDREGGQ